MNEKLLEAALLEVRTLLGLPDDEQEELLEVLVQSAITRLGVLLGVDAIPDRLSYIVTEVAVIRYNRIGSEGMSAHAVEGESISFSDNDFAGFLGDIEAWRDEQAGTKRGRVRFL